MGRYQLGIDLGTTWTAAAVCREGREHPEVLPLGITANAVATVVFLAADGQLLVGEAAQRRALTEPRRIAREFKRRLGDGTPLLVGGESVAAEELCARFVAHVVEQARQREGGPAETIAVTHPAEWGEHKRTAFTAALAAQGMPEVRLLTEPQAAALAYAQEERIEPGHVVAVYDLGGGTFDAAVVRRRLDGTFELLGAPAGIARLGGVDFDDAVLAHVRTALGDAWTQLDPTDTDVQAAVTGLRRECTSAKEALSADTEVQVPVMLPGTHTQVRLGRAEFEDMIRPAIGETVETLRRAVDSAGIAPEELHAVLLVGGSSRIPLVAQQVSAELGRSIVVDADPKAVVAAGAALAARGPLVDAAPAVPDHEPDTPPVEFAAPPAHARGGHRRLLLLASAGLAVALLGASAGVATGLVPLPVLTAQTSSADPVAAPTEGPVTAETAAEAAAAAIVAPPAPVAQTADGVAVPAPDRAPTAAGDLVARPGATGAPVVADRPVPRATTRPGAPAVVPRPAAPAPVVPPAQPPAGTPVPGPVIPAPVDPGPTVPPVDPGPTEPGPTPTDPGPTEPGPSDPPPAPGPSTPADPPPPSANPGA